MDHSFLSHNYTRRDVVSHHVQACANMSCFEISLPNTLFRTVIRYSVVFWFVRPDVEPILNTLWVEKEKHQKIYIYILSIRVVDFVKDNETAASTISISAYPLACTTLHPFWHVTSQKSTLSRPPCLGLCSRTDYLFLWITVLPWHLRFWASHSVFRVGRCCYWSMVHHDSCSTVSSSEWSVSICDWIVCITLVPNRTGQFQAPNPK